MSSITIYPSILKGSVTAPPSKSASHRAIICAALSWEKSIISNVMLSDDIMATINAMRALGACIDIDNGKLHIKGNTTDKPVVINCRESGSTMRFIIPIAAAMGISARFIGEGRLPERTIGEYIRILDCNGVSVSSKNGFLPLEISGRLKGGSVNIRGDISSQFVSGLLLAAPLTNEGLEINLTTKLESRPYVDLTIDIMRRFGVKVNATDNGYFLDEGEKYKASDYCIEGDYSQAAFWLVAKALGSDIVVEGLENKSSQGDMEIINIINDMHSNSDIKINAEDIPDLVPIITVLAGLRPNQAKTIIVGAKRLRLKESDRLLSTSAMLDVLGADYTLTDDGFIINGVDNYKGGVIDSYNDHRIAMSAAIASTRAINPITILGSECIRKSYGSFYQELIRLGGRINNG